MKEVYEEYLISQPQAAKYHKIIAAYEDVLLVMKVSGHKTSLNKINFLNDTRGLRLLLSGSMNSRRYVELFLEEKTGSIENWFAEVSYGGTDLRALQQLLEDKVDVVSLEERTYKSFLEKHAAVAANYEMVWFSADIPRAVVVGRPGMKMNKKWLALLRPYTDKQYQWFPFAESNENFKEWQFRIAGKKFDYLSYFSEDSQ